MSNFGRDRQLLERKIGELARRREELAQRDEALRQAEQALAQRERELRQAEEETARQLAQELQYRERRNRWRANRRDRDQQGQQ